MTDLEELYQDLIKDHSRKPRNCHVMPGENRHIEGYNPLCGDRFTVFVKIENDIVRDISFQGKGCAISTASASLMTQILKGKTTAEAEELFQKFHAFLTGGEPVGATDSLGKLQAFAGVRKFPVRIKCATLPWHTVHAALAGEETIVTTE